MKDVKNLFIHKISALISNNVDVIIISKVLGLVNVVIYTTYNYIINSLIVDNLSFGNRPTTQRLSALRKQEEYNVSI